MLTEYVRNALRRTISHQYAVPDEQGKLRLHCVTLDPASEEVISSYVDRGPAGTVVSVPTPIARQLAAAVSATGESLLTRGNALVVVTSPSVRAPVKQVLDNQMQGVIVLGYNEIVRGVDVESSGLVQLPGTQRAVPMQQAVGAA